jgi:hypothetical protein
MLIEPANAISSAIFHTPVTILEIIHRIPFKHGVSETGLSIRLQMERFQFGIADIIRLCLRQSPKC